MTGPDRLSMYYRTKAQELRSKAEACSSRTARMWLAEAANECELRAIQAEGDLASIGAAAAPDAPRVIP